MDLTLIIALCRQTSNQHLLVHRHQLKVPQSQALAEVGAILSVLQAVVIARAVLPVVRCQVPIQVTLAVVLCRRLLHNQVRRELLAQLLRVPAHLKVPIQFRRVQVAFQVVLVQE